MADDFDPYYKWLGIAPEDQPPNHYQLLGVRNFESDHDVLGNAADKQMSHLRSFQGGKRAELSQKVLNEVSAARLCLLNADKKKAYDKQLQKELDAANSDAQKATSSKPGLRAPAEVRFEGKKTKQTGADAEQQIPSPSTGPALTTPMPQLTPLEPLKGDDAFDDPAIDAVVIPDAPSGSGILNRTAGVRQQTAPRPLAAAQPRSQSAVAGGSAIGRGPALPAESRLIYIIIGSVLFCTLTLAGVLMANSLSRGASSFTGAIMGAGRRRPTPPPPAPRPVDPRSGRPTTVFPRPATPRPGTPRPGTPRPKPPTAFPATGTAATKSRIQFFWPPVAQRTGRVQVDGQTVTPDISGSMATVTTTPGSHTFAWRRQSFETPPMTVDAVAGETQLVHGNWQTQMRLVNARSVDLAAVADVGAGPQSWTRQGTMLTSPVVVPAGPDVIGISKTPPEEYIIDIRAMRMRGTGPLHIGLEQAGHRFSIVFGGPDGVALGRTDNGYTALQPTDPDLFTFGRAVGLRIYVAPGYVGVETRLGKLRNFKGDFSRFHRDPAWETSTPLSIGIRGAGFRILSLRMYTDFE